ncbi:helix-turn-helix domain-containing protein [Streptomyces caeni]|uniref:Helix-turn-helix domain-containing protein n=1 Tax=Streptomyces caeni TaxID=2307231 RepID=A0ABW4J1Y0_9ACTN
MGAWQPLPDELPSEVRHFVEQLRLLKDRTGLSLVALGARTAYSKSSWQRYLNATQPPPRQAVAALCRVAGLPGAEAERFAVRWELAVGAWSRPQEPAPAQVPAPDRLPAPAAAPPRAAAPAQAPGAGPVPGEYEDDPTVPWWDRLEERRETRPAGRRLLLVALLALVTLLAVALVGTVTLG